jgi:hypothetical protein
MMATSGFGHQANEAVEKVRMALTEACLSYKKAAASFEIG